MYGWHINSEMSYLWESFVSAGRINRPIWVTWQSHDRLTLDTSKQFLANKIFGRRLTPQFFHWNTMATWCSMKKSYLFKNPMRNFYFIAQKAILNKEGFWANFNSGVWPRGKCQRKREFSKLSIFWPKVAQIILKWRGFSESTPEMKYLPMPEARYIK